MLAAFALSLALAQEPTSHAQAVTCTGVFVNVFAVTADTAQREPTDANRELAATVGDLVKLANDDRLAAARREGLSIEASGDQLKAWLAATTDAQAAIDRELDGCLAIYFDRL